VSKQRRLVGHSQSGNVLLMELNIVGVVLVVRIEGNDFVGVFGVWVVAVVVVVLEYVQCMVFVEVVVVVVVLVDCLDFYRISQHA